MDGTPCEKRPDADNILKLVADALNGVAYDDDKRVVVASVCKLWSSQPRLEITIEPIGATE
jgi:Holliday junction resolvase RusA-like endonuclease